MYTYSSLQQREDKKRISLQNVHGHAAFRCKSLNTLWIKENSWYQSTPYTFNICTRNVHELKFSHYLIIVTFTKWFQNNLVHDKICTLFSFLMEQQWSVLYFFSIAKLIIDMTNNFWFLPQDQPSDYGIPMIVKYSLQKNLSVTEELLSEMVRTLVILKQIKSLYSFHYIKKDNVWN